MSVSRVSHDGPSCSDQFVEVLLSHFTPADSGVITALDSTVTAQHCEDLCLRLMLASELASPGRGAAVVRGLINSELSGEILLESLDAALEFGVLPGDLSVDDRAKAQRAEIRQEVLHFDRIMDLDALTTGRLLKKRRDIVSSGSLGAVERILTLVYERCVMSGRMTPEWQDLSASVNGLLSSSGEGASVRRTVRPYFVATCQADNSDDAIAALELFEHYAVRHAIPVAMQLLAYDRYSKSKSVASVVASRMWQDECGGLQADVWSTEPASWIIVGRDGFMQRLISAGVVGGDNRNAGIGTLGFTTVPIDKDAWIVIALDEGQFAQSTEVESVLNAKSKKGRINLQANLDNYFASTPYVVAKVQTVAREVTPDSTISSDALHRMSGVVVDSAKTLHLSIESGHVHADREFGPAQQRGLEMGARVLSAVEDYAGQLGVPMVAEVVPMIDDDHVLNRFKFGEYRSLHDETLRVTDLILESSPLARAIAHDVLRVALRNADETYKVEQIGGNLYLSTSDLRVELVEDIHGEMRNGCVLFEIGLVLLRAARAELTAVFWDVIGMGQRDIHSEMARAYDDSPDPLDRERIRREYEKMYVDPWGDVSETLDKTPFFDAYESVMIRRRSVNTKTVVLNVLEDYYRPQQEKVVATAKLLKIDLPLAAVFFGPHSHGIELMVHSILSSSNSVGEKLS